MTNTYVPVQELPTGASVNRKAGLEYLGETRQGLLEVASDKAYVGWWSRYKRLLSVTTNAIPLNWTANLPSKESVRHFQVDVAIRIRPADCTRLAGSAGYDFAPDIIVEVDDNLRQVSRLHSANDVASLESNLRRWAFNRHIVSEAFLIAYGSFFVKMDGALAKREINADDAKGSHNARRTELERRMEIAQMICPFLPDVPSRSVVAFDLAENPERVTQYIEVIERAYGEQQRATIEKLEKISEFFRQGSLDSVDLAGLLARVIGGDKDVPRADPSVKLLPPG